jgi:hypothetical protein
MKGLGKDAYQALNRKPLDQNCHIKEKEGYPNEKEA